MSFQVRHATEADLDGLLELERVWPENARATSLDLQRRIKKFPEGYLLAEDETGIFASIIAHPYSYDGTNLTSFTTWTYVLNQCFESDCLNEKSNALYLVSGTSKRSKQGAAMFLTGMQYVSDLALSMKKSYIIAGALLPGYANYIKKHGHILAEDYVFKQSQGRCVDPLIERYRQMGFHVPSKTHVLPEYFPDEASLNYSALVVKCL